MQMTCLYRPIVYLRHGLTDWNLQGRLMGRTDIPLNDQGCQQARSAIDILKFLKISLIVHSPLQRCQETVDIINSALHLPSFSHEGLTEADLGIWEGLTKDPTHSFELWKSSSHALKGETYKKFQTRVMQSLDDIFTVSKFGLVLVVSHGGVFEVIREKFNAPPFYLSYALPVLMYPYLETTVLQKRQCHPLIHAF